jgi:hypothetical protein
MNDWTEDYLPIQVTRTPMLIEVDGVWINPGYVVRVWGKEDMTLIRFTDGSVLAVDVTVAKAVETINGGQLP